MVISTRALIIQTIFFDHLCVITINDYIANLILENN
mgnify:FL=1